MDIPTIVTLLGRDLTESERRTVEWLQGWSRETQENVMTFIVEAWQRGLQFGRP
ncbi:hypothetical protein [Paenibacillus ginsengihumi]|uniref:hypothetical protein n=1 Tax=Paenibacillus ginsengihumi TaxID=431596 RepID=UPI00035C1B53|nr:hypothetical protein [Paenibacillus ginsengihumi]